MALQSPNGSSFGGIVTLVTSGTPGLEMRSTGGAGPVIDMSNDNVSDFDARIILLADDQLAFRGAVVRPEAGFAFASAYTATQITADQDDYAPTGVATANILRLSSDAARSITGITAPANDGTLLVLENSGAHNITLKHEVTSTAANRFWAANQTDVVLRPYGAVLLFYSTAASRWRIVGA